MFEVTNSSLIINADADDPDGDSSGARFQYIPCYYEWPVPEPAAITERGKAAPWCRVWLPECIADRSSPPSRCRVQRLINGGTYLQALFYLTATAPVSSLLAAAAGLDSLGRGKGKKPPALPGAADPASLATAAPGDKISMTWSVADAMMERMMRCDEPDTDEALALLPATAAPPEPGPAPAAVVDAAAGAVALAVADDVGDGPTSSSSSSSSSTSTALASVSAHSRSLLEVRTSSAWMQCLKWAGFVTRRLISMPAFPRLKATRVPQTAGEVLSVVACSPELRTLCRGLLSQSVDEQPDPMLLHQALEHAVAATAAHHFPRIALGNKARVAKQLDGVSAILKKLMLSSGKSCACGKCVFESFSSYAFGLALVTSLHPPGDLPALPARVSFDRPACAWSCRAFDDGYAAVRWSGLMGGEVGVEDVRSMLETALDRVRRMGRLVDDTRECGSGGGPGSGGGSGSGSAGSSSSSGSGGATAATASAPQPNVERGLDFVATLARVVMVTVRDALTVYARVYPRFLSTLVADEALAEPPAPGSSSAAASAGTAAAVGGAGAGSGAIADAAEAAAATAIVPVGKAAAAAATKGDANAKSGKATHAHAHAHAHPHSHAHAHAHSHGHSHSHAALSHALAHPTISTITSADGSITASAIVDLLPALDGAPTTLAELAAQLSAVGVGAAACGCDGHHDHDGHGHGHGHGHGFAGHGHTHGHGHGHKALPAPTSSEPGAGGKKALPAASAPPTAAPSATAAPALPPAPPLPSAQTPATAPAPAPPAPAPLVLPDLAALPPSALRLLQREVERLTRRKGELAREAAALARAHGEYASLADADAGELARVQGDIEAVRAATATAGAAADAAERRYEGFRGRIAEADLHVKELEAVAKACAASRARLESTLELRDALRGELEALRVVTSAARESVETLAKSTKSAAALAASRRAQAAALKAAAARPATHDKDVAALKRAAEAAEASAASAVAREAAALEEAAALKAKIASLKALKAAPALQMEIDNARTAAAASREAAAAAAKAKAATDAARAAAKDKAAAEKAALEQRRAAALRASEALRRQMGAAEAELARLKEGMIAAASARDAAIAAAMAILGGAPHGSGAGAGASGSDGAGAGAGAGSLQLPMAMPLPSLSLPFAFPGSSVTTATGTATAASLSFSLSSDSGSGGGSSSGLSASAPAFTLPGSEDHADVGVDASTTDVLAGLTGLPGFSLAGLGLTAGLGVGVGGTHAGDAAASTSTLQALQTLQAFAGAGGWQS